MTNDEILVAAKKNLKALGDSLGKTVATILKTDNMTNSTDLYLQLIDVKESFTRIYGKLKEIPDLVYTEIAKTLITEIDSIIFTKYSKDELLDQIATQIEKIFTKIDDKEITVGDKTYKISFKGSNFGLKGKFIRISDGDKESWLNWNTGSYNKSVMARYVVSIFKSDTYFSETTFPKVLSLLNSKGNEFFSAILDDSIALKKILGSVVFKAFGSDIQYKLESLMLSVSDDKVRETLLNYVSLNNAYKDLTAGIESAQNVTDIKNLSANFTTLAETVNNSLKSFSADVNLEDLSLDYELKYNKNYTEVTIPAGYTTELKNSDYKSSVRTIYAGNFDESIIIHGNNKNNIITGGKNNDKIYGYKENDTIYGGKGHDMLYGGVGNDKLYGGAGKDTIYGGKGNDSLWGGTGNDTLFGDAGADTFIYTKGDGKDVIYGFDSKDTLTIDNLDFTTSYNKSKGTITFNVSGGSITLKEFTATTFHINDDIYKISGSKLKKQ